MSSACEAGFVLGLDATYFPATVPVSLTSTTPRFSSHSSLIRSFPHFPVAFIPRQPLKTCPSGTCTTETRAALAEEGDRAKLWRRGQKNEGLVLIWQRWLCDFREINTRLQAIVSSVENEAQDFSRVLPDLMVHESMIFNLLLLSESAVNWKPCLSQPVA